MRRAPGRSLVLRRASLSWSCLAAIAVVSDAAVAGTINVPADYSTIQGAIDAAVAGDVVLVAPGTYVENIDFKGKAITVESSGGSDVTTIDGGGHDSVVRFVSGEGTSSILDGFHLTNGLGPNYGGPNYFGGGISCQNGPGPVIRNNLIDYNVSAVGAGGIGCDNSSPTIERNQINHNQGMNGGGIVTFNGANPYVSECDISWNSVTNLGWGGGIQCSWSSATVVNTTIAFNTAGYEGGGIQQGDQGAVTLINCVVWGNSCGKGSGVFVWLTTLTAWNTIIWNNDVSGSVDAHYSDIQGGGGSQGNVDIDPLFVDPTNDDFHISANSPCVDIGSSSAPSLPTTDFDGDPRNLGANVDIGADESAPKPVVSSASPTLARYDSAPAVAIQGSDFSIGGPISVRFGSNLATNVVVLDDANLTCDAPLGDPGPVDVGVSNSYGEGVLPSGFIFTPAITIEGTATPGGSVTIHYLFDVGDGAFAIYGLPPQVSLTVPPYDGTLGILPYYVLFVLPPWPFGGFDVDADIPNDPTLSGVDVLLQALIGPRLTKKPKDGAWTNCAVLAIR